MKLTAFVLAGLLSLPLAVRAEEADRTHFPAKQPPPTGVVASGAPATASAAPFSAAVLAGKTLYVSGAIDLDPATGKLGATPEESAKLALDAVQASVTAAGMTMDDLVWVQVFCTDLSYFPKFNTVYRTYFHGPLPARAFLGVDHLLGNAHFEVMGVAVKKAP